MTQEASVIVVTHNSAKHIGPTLAGLVDDPKGPAQVVVVDNASTDATRDIIADYDVDTVFLEDNLGLAAGCHRGVEDSRYSTIVFVSPDVVVRSGWLPALLAALEDPKTGAASATLELADKPGHLNSSGGELTYFGLAWATDLGAPLDADEELKDVPFAPGAAMAMRRTTWDQVGGFRRELQMYHEDVDLGWRLQMLGFRSVRVPQALVLHDYEFSRNPTKLFLLERNRLILLASNYRRSTFALIAPAVAVVELGVLLVAIRDGWPGAKLRSWTAAWRMRRTTRQWYRRVQADRTVGDASIMERMGTSIGGVSQVAAPSGAGIVGRLLGWYLRLVLPIVRRADRRLGLA